MSAARTPGFNKGDDEGKDKIAIVVRGLEKAFGKHRVLCGVDLDIERGKINIIIGGSGQGKSVLMKHLMGLLKPDKGQILVDGEDIVPLDDFELNRVRRKFGMLFQYAALFDSLTVEQNVAFALVEHTKMSKDEIHAEVMKQLDSLGLKNMEKKFPNELSGGQRKRVGLARALVLKPEILLYDEPTTGLDPVATKNVDDMIQDISKNLGVTSVVISHDMASAFRIGDRISMLYEGKIIVSGSREKFLADGASNDYVREFVEMSGAVHMSGDDAAKGGTEMNPTSQAIKVGATFLLIGLLSFIGFRFVAKGIQGGGGYGVFAKFRDATGLVDKSRVQIAGLTVGEITTRQLEGVMARVNIRMRPDVPLYANAAIFKKSASLLGEFYLDIDPGTPQSPDPATGLTTINRKLKDGDEIVNVIEAVTPADIMVQVNETLPVLRQILSDVHKITEGPLQDIAKGVQQGVQRNSEAAERLINHMDEIALDIRGVTGGQATSDLKKTLSNVRDISEGLKSLVGTGQGELTSTGDKVRNQLDNIGTAIANLNKTLENVADVSAKVKKGEGTIGRLLNDETIANNVEQITEDAGSFLHSITRLQTIVGLRSEYNVLANTLKTYVAITLQSRPDKYFLIELVDDPRGYRQNTRTFVTTDDPSKPQTTNTDTVTITDQFRFSFMLAKSLFLLNGRLAVTGRFGIKESTGGVGVDFSVPLALARDWLRTAELKIDVFDFRTNIYPRVKVLAALEFFKHMWVVGGIDDAFNGRGPGAGGSTGRDYFFGAQLTFNDDDLRGLLTIGGAALIGAAGGK